MSSPADLDRRLSKKIESGKAIQLTPADLDLLIESGAIDTFRQFVSDYQRAKCLERNVQNRSTGGANSPSTNEPAEISKSSGTTLSAAVSEQQARALAILTKAA